MDSFHEVDDGHWLQLASLESCEECFGYLAYSVRERLERGRGLSSPEVEQMRGLAVELLTRVAGWILPSTPQFGSSGDVALLERERRLVRLIRTMQSIFQRSTSTLDLAETLQSAADLIRSMRMDQSGPWKSRLSLP